MLLIDLDDYLGFGPIELITSVGDGCLNVKEIDLLSGFIEGTHEGFVAGLFQWYENSTSCLPKTSPCRGPIEEQFTKVSSIFSIYIDVKDELFRKFKDGTITDVDLGNYKNFMFNYRCEVKSLLKLVDGDEITSCSISDAPLDKCLGTVFSFIEFELSSVGRLSVGNLTSEGQQTLTDYVIEWFNESGDVEFTSGYGDVFSGQYTYTHPLTGDESIPLPSDKYTPKIKFIRYGDVNYSDDGNTSFEQNDFNGCLGYEFEVLPYNCLCEQENIKTITLNNPNWEKILNDNTPEEYNPINEQECVSTIWGVLIEDKDGNELYSNTEFFNNDNNDGSTGDLFPSYGDYYSEVLNFVRQYDNLSSVGLTIYDTSVGCESVLEGLKINISLKVDQGCSDEPCDDLSGSAVIYTQPPTPNFTFEIAENYCNTPTDDASLTYEQVYTDNDDITVSDDIYSYNVSSGSVFYTDPNKTIPYVGSGEKEYFIRVGTTDDTPVIQNFNRRYVLDSSGEVTSVTNCI